MYIVGAADQGHSLLDGSHRYLIHFTSGQLPPPARYFWSLTVYDKDFFLVANPINRYEISSHTAGLHYNADGSLDIYLQADDPAGRESNWLPAAAQRPVPGHLPALRAQAGGAAAQLRLSAVGPDETESQNAPRRLSTAGIVLSRIDRSSMIDQRSRYRKSSRTRSSKSRSERPDTCHRPVIPGSTR